MQITANIVEIFHKRIFFGTVIVEEGIIASIEELGDEKTGEPYLMPGFIDAHVHIESSMLVPTEFARLAVRHGTVATVSDPHEIANVLGKEGVLYMLHNAEQTPFHFFFGVPSCVPATSFETAGDVLDHNAVNELIQRDDLWYLAEVMNYPGVLSGDPELVAKIAAAKAAGKPVDGHAPGLAGNDAVKYIASGITTDHECTTYAEALHKLKNGMHIIIREGSAAKNFEALHSLIGEFPEKVMFCSDDKHPDDLIVSHINGLSARAIEKGYEWSSVLLAACVNPVLHYGLPVGLLRKGDAADMILVSDLREFAVRKTWIRGQVVFAQGQTLLPEAHVTTMNKFGIRDFQSEALRVPSVTDKKVRVIRAIDGSLLTEEVHLTLRQVGGFLQSDEGQDVLKIAVVNRFQESKPAVAWIHGIGIKDGAIASCVAHDSHNIVAVGSDDETLARAIRLIIDHRGGISAVSAVHDEHVLPLPVAGIMSDRKGEEVAAAYTKIDQFAKQVLGSGLRAPFMTLSFMALLVIPQLKLSDLGLFDGATFQFVDTDIP